MRPEEFNALTEIKRQTMPPELTLEQRSTMSTAARQADAQLRISIEKSAKRAVQLGGCAGPIGACALCSNGLTCERVNEIVTQSVGINNTLSISGD
jgi:hypothetical protein